MFDTPLGRIGIEICYDLRFPELTRALALAGADIVVLPTNWPLAARANAELLAPRALREPDLPAGREPRRPRADGRVLRPEPDRRPAGTRLAEADATSEELLVADIDVELARDKSIIPAPGSTRCTCSATGGRSSTVL